MPLDVLGEHAQEDVRTDARLGSVVDGTDFEAARLHAAEDALEAGEALVVAYDLLAGDRRIAGLLHPSSDGREIVGWGQKLLYRTSAPRSESCPGRGAIPTDVVGVDLVRRSHILCLQGPHRESGRQ